MADQQFWPLYIDAVESLIETCHWKEADTAHRRYNRALALQQRVQALWQRAEALSVTAQQYPQLNLAVADCLNPITEDFNSLSQRLKDMMSETARGKKGSLDRVLALLSEAWFVKYTHLVEAANTQLEASQSAIDQEKARLEQLRKAKRERILFLIKFAICTVTVITLAMIAMRSPVESHTETHKPTVTTAQKEQSPGNHPSQEATKAIVPPLKSPQSEAPPKAEPVTKLDVSRNVVSLTPQGQAFSAQPETISPSSTAPPKGPTSVTTTIPPDFKAFVEQIWRHTASNNPAEAASDYADVVDYCYSKKPATRSFVEEDRRKLIQRYPTRKYSFEKNYSSSFPNELEANVTYSFSYTYTGSKTASGHATVSITARKLAGQWKIVKFNESVTRNP